MCCMMISAWKRISQAANYSSRYYFRMQNIANRGEAEILEIKMDSKCMDQYYCVLIEIFKAATLKFVHVRKWHGSHGDIFRTLETTWVTIQICHVQPILVNFSSHRNPIILHQYSQLIIHDKIEFIQATQKKLIESTLQRFCKKRRSYLHRLPSTA